MNLKRILANDAAIYALEDHGSGPRLLRILNGRRTHDLHLGLPVSYLENEASSMDEVKTSTIDDIVELIGKLPIYPRYTRSNEVYGPSGKRMPIAYLRAWLKDRKRVLNGEKEDEEIGDVRYGCSGCGATGIGRSRKAPEGWKRTNDNRFRCATCLKR